MKQFAKTRVSNEFHQEIMLFLLLKQPYFINVIVFVVIPYPQSERQKGQCTVESTV